MARVGVHKGGAWDPSIVQRVLGVVPHDLPPVSASVITIDGFIENDATAWLREVDARSGLRRTKTALTRADSLRAFLNYVLAQNTSIRGATNAHIIGYILRYVDATDFGAHAVEWVLLVHGQGHVVLTVWRAFRSLESSR